jgi:hypothetical protein
MLLASGGAFALGLGDLRGTPRLGESYRLEVDVLGDAKAALDVGCFKLIRPTAGGDLPWIKKAALSLRKGQPSVLEIRSDAALREPIVQLAVQLGCGHEVVREYTLLLSPASENSSPQDMSVASPRRSTDLSPPMVRPVSPRARSDAERAVSRRSPSGVDGGGQRAVRVEREFAVVSVDVGEPALRLSTGLPVVVDVQEAQRDILRLEYRMLMAMNEQATTQLATAEKLRGMEATLGELQQRATDLARNVESGGQPVAPVAPQSTAAVQDPAATSVAAISPQSSVAEDGFFSDWAVYGLLLGGLFGAGGWLGWQRYQRRRQEGAFDPQGIEPEFQVDPPRDEEKAVLAVAADVPVEPVVPVSPVSVDLEVEAQSGHSLVPLPELRPPPSTTELDSVLSMSSTTVDEHFEANPVMELADIMLSFGRVKGAAQALQEYIDNNPQEALQPWIRLMEVYRMAGMRAEFEAVSRNLNQNFNVEVQRWSDEPVAEAHETIDLVLDERVDSGPVAPVAPRPSCLEDMPRIMGLVVDNWRSGDVVGYLYQLLRDNRGGQRVGFALPVVEEILFLIELKETANRMEKDAT